MLKPEYVRLLALLKAAGEIELMLRGTIDYKRLAELLRKFGIDVSEKELKEIKDEYEQSGNKKMVIRRVAEMLGISPESIEDAIMLFELLSAT